MSRGRRRRLQGLPQLLLQVGKLGEILERMRNLDVVSGALAAGLSLSEEDCSGHTEGVLGQGLGRGAATVPLLGQKGFGMRQPLLEEVGEGCGARVSVQGRSVKRRRNDWRPVGFAARPGQRGVGQLQSWPDTTLGAVVVSDRHVVNNTIVVVVIFILAIVSYG